MWDCCNDYMSLLRFFNKFKSMAIQSLIITGLRLIALATAISLSFSLKNIIKVYTLFEIINGLSLLIISLRFLYPIAKNYYKKSPLSLIKNDIKKYMLILINANITSYLKVFYNKIDILLLGFLSDESNVGIYKVAKNIVGIIGQITNPFYIVVFPEVINLYNKSKDAFLNFIKRTTFFILMTVIPISIGMVIFTNLVINILFGIEFIKASFLVRIMIWGIVINQVFIWLYPYYVAINKLKIVNLIMIVSVVILITFSFILIPVYEAIGSAIINLINPIVVTILMLYGFYRYSTAK